RKPEEQPVHLVTVPPFFIGAFEVTRGQWRRGLALPKVRDDLLPIYRLNMPEEVENSLPVDIIFFHNAEEFCARIAKFTGRPYRLPSEAEWEFACRAGTSTAYHFGDGIGLDVANYNDGVHRPLDLTPVGAKNAPNAFGLHDMHGNVAEWCLDWEHATYQGAPTDGSPWVDAGQSDRRVIRGGSFVWNPQVARSTARMFWFVSSSASGIGFRLALGPCPELRGPRHRRRP
ncbi:MAG TPA: formylglycine-generating enzyme family protein, partial [Acidobacteriota bacterium]